MQFQKYLILSMQFGMIQFQKLLALLTRGEWPPFCSVLAIIEQNDTLLMIDRTDGQGIFFPGGFLKIAESPEQAVIREIREETGFEVLPQRLQGAYTPKGQRIQSVVLCYICTIVGGTKKSSSEGELLWIRRNQAVEMVSTVCLPFLEDYERKS